MRSPLSPPSPELLAGKHSGLGRGVLWLAVVRHRGHHRRQPMLPHGGSQLPLNTGGHGRRRTDDSAECRGSGLPLTAQCRHTCSGSGLPLTAQCRNSGVALTTASKAAQPHSIVHTLLSTDLGGRWSCIPPDCRRPLLALLHRLSLLHCFRVLLAGQGRAALPIRAAWGPALLAVPAAHPAVIKQRQLQRVSKERVESAGESQRGWSWHPTYLHSSSPVSV